MRRWQLKNICLMDSWTFFTVMPTKRKKKEIKKMQERKKNPLISTSFYSLGKGLYTTWARQQSRQKSNVVSQTSIPKVQNGKAPLSFCMEKEIMKMMEVDQNQGLCQQIPERLKCSHSGSSSLLPC